jgi:hypothetical protein
LYLKRPRWTTPPSELLKTTPNFSVFKVVANIMCWGVSFYYGCQNLTWVQTAIYANYNLLQLKAGVHPEQPPHLELTNAAISGVSTALDNNAANAQFFGVWQFRMLITGAVFFIGWRVAEMVRLTYAA